MRLRVRKLPEDGILLPKHVEEIFIMNCFFQDLYFSAFY